MDALALRHELAAFLGIERFQKFVKYLRRVGRLRFWQENEWAKFVELHPEFVVGLDDLQASLRICELHLCELQRGTSGVFHGCRDHTNRYIRVRNQLFPNAETEPVSTEGSPVNGGSIEVWYCPKCRVAETTWKDGLKPIVTLEDLLSRRERYPQLGIAVNDLLRALEAVAASEEVADKRVMGFRLYSDGHLVVTTGELLGGCSGGGNTVLLRKEAEQWVVVEVSRWLS